MGKRKVARRGAGRTDQPERTRIAYRHLVDQAGWTVAYHLITLDPRISDGALRLYLLLHRYAQQRGETWTSVGRLAQDLRVTERTIQRRLQELTRLGLIERTRSGFGATFTTYILDPRDRYSELLRKSGLIPDNNVQYGEAIPDKNVRYGEAIPDKNVRSYRTKMSAHEEITSEEIQEQEEGERESEMAEIAQTLEENGVFAAAAGEIARKMAEAGLGPEEALEVLLGTIQSIQTGMPRGEEEVMSLAVDRLQRGIWDAGERTRRTLRRAWYRERREGLSQPRGGEVMALEGETLQGESERSAGEEIWRAVLEQLQLELTRATFDTWLRPTRAVGREEGVLVVRVASVYAREWLESRLQGMVERALERVTGEPLRVRFVVGEGG